MKTEFTHVGKLEEWLRNVVKAEKYDLYFDKSDRTLYAVKNVSTEPRIHGYVKGVCIDGAGQLGNAVSRRVTTVESFEWDHDKTDTRE